MASLGKYFNEVILKMDCLLSDAMIALQLFDHRIPSAMASFDVRRVEKAEQFILMNHLLLSVVEHVLPVLHLADGKP